MPVFFCINTSSVTFGDSSLYTGEPYPSGKLDEAMNKFN